jgi:hypothetical protein
MNTAAPAAARARLDASFFRLFCNPFFLSPMDFKFAPSTQFWEYDAHEHLDRPGAALAAGKERVFYRARFYRGFFIRAPDGARVFLIVL